VVSVREILNESESGVTKVNLSNVRCGEDGKEIEKLRSYLMKGPLDSVTTWKNAKSLEKTSGSIFKDKEKDMGSYLTSGFDDKINSQ
jgi:hypothetical protein